MDLLSAVMKLFLLTLKSYLGNFITDKVDLNKLTALGLSAMTGLWVILMINYLAEQATNNLQLQAPLITNNTRLSAQLVEIQLENESLKKTVNRQNMYIYNLSNSCNVDPGEAISITDTSVTPTK